MGLETPAFVNDLVVTNPTSSDTKSQGDDHIRNLKTALKSTFPNASKAFYLPDVVSKAANYSVVAADMHKTIFVDTTAGAVVLTMPTLVIGDAGWSCSIVKTNTGLNPVFIAPPSGVIQSGAVGGLARTRRCIPWTPTRVLWTGALWVAERAVQVPVGAILDFSGAALPVGFEWPNGQTLTSASTDYPDFNSVNGSGLTLNLCGRVSAGKDNMGGASNDRLTAAGSGIDGDVLGAAGGTETHVLTEGQIPIHTHTGSAAPAGTHSHSVGTFNNATPSGAGPALGINALGSAATSVAPDHTHGITIGNAGGGGAHNNVQPTIVMNKILVVE